MLPTERSLWHSEKVTLDDDIDLSSTKPFKAVFNGKIFTFTRQQGWKKLYETIAKELYHLNPDIMLDLARQQIEFFISDEPVCWALDNRDCAINYEDSWWSKIAANVYIYTKNRTSRKIENIKALFDAYDVQYSSLEIVLY